MAVVDDILITPELARGLSEAARELSISAADRAQLAAEAGVQRVQAEFWFGRRKAIRPLVPRAAHNRYLSEIEENDPGLYARVRAALALTGQVTQVPTTEGREIRTYHEQYTSLAQALQAVEEMKEGASSGMDPYLAERWTRAHLYRIDRWDDGYHYEWELEVEYDNEYEAGEAA